MALPIPKKLKRILKGWLNRIQLAYIRWRYTFDVEDFARLLQRLGLKKGDVVMVHSSYNNFEGFTGKPTDVINALEMVIGPEGTLLMPTMPFSGTAVDFVRKGKPLDILRTPSRMGFLTELFRRMPDVVRSAHPTHPVAVWGSLSETMIKDHHLSASPCGTDSPFGKLLEHNGRLLFLGTGLGVLTFLHTIEEILEPDMPFSVFTEEIFDLTCIVKPGVELKTRTRLYDPEVSRTHKRNPFKLIPELKKLGKWKQMRLGRLDAILINAQDVLDATRTMAKRGEFCYDS